MTIRKDNIRIHDSDMETQHALISADILAGTDDKLVFFAIQDCQPLTEVLGGLGLAQTSGKGAEDG